MNERASKLFSQLLDVNWEISQHKAHKRQSPTFFADLIALEERYAEIELEVKAEMGETEYHRFIQQGKKMFGVK